MEKIIQLWEKYGFVFLDGLKGTLWLALVTVSLGTVLGVLIAFIRMSKFKPLSLIAKFYIDILRGTPILLQLYIFVFSLPKLMQIDLSEGMCAIIALIINSSAYIAEIIRAGINAVDSGQWEGAKSLGLSEFNMMKRIILPQAIKNILPALGNEFIVMVKETSLTSIFFLGDLMTSYKTIQAATFLTIQPLVIVGMIYFSVNYILSAVVRLCERRLKVSD